MRTGIQPSSREAITVATMSFMTLSVVLPMSMQMIDASDQHGDLDRQAEGLDEDQADDEAAARHAAGPGREQQPGQDDNDDRSERQRLALRLRGEQEDGGEEDARPVFR